MTNHSPDHPITVLAHSALQDRANAEAVERICAAQPVLLDVRPAIEVVPGMTEETILTSGAALVWEEYTGGQRTGIVGGALYEGLATSADEVDAEVRAGKIRVRPCQEHGCVGSLS